MIKPDQHINHSLRQKFQDFEPLPPKHIWENIEKSLDADKGFFFGNIKYYAAAILLISLFSVLYFGLYSDSNSQISPDIDKEKISHENLTPVEDQNNAKLKTIDIEEEDANNDETTEKNEVLEITIVESMEKEDISTTELSESEIKKVNELKNLDLFKLEEGFTKPINNSNINNINRLSITSVYSLSYGLPYSKDPNVFSGIPENNKISTSRWENTVFIGSEFSLTNLDSVTILNSYSIGVEPSRFFNENWFVRFGFNASYTGDKGFAKIDYISNDFMGTYNDVYNVTFDTIGGIITPHYHTKTVEVWDSVRHIVVSEVTNRYLFAQMPVLLGYKNKIGQLNWYIYSGPVIGFQIAKWIDEPSIELKDIEIIDLDNNLPVRSSINYQLWMGAGIEYKLGRNTSIIIEPSYRHYFKSLYNDAEYKFNISGFALRLGFNYKIGH